MNAISASATLRAVSTTGLALICSLGAVAASPPLPSTVSTTMATQRRLIAEGFAGAVRIGMTVAQARVAVRPLTLGRTSDGEGVALIGVMRGQATVMTLYAGEEDPSRRINDRARIESIEVWDPSYSTSAGVNPGMPLRDVETRYGRLTEIDISEVESREYAYFANLPHGIALRVDADGSTAGIYPADQRAADRYDTSARVVSIIVTSAANHTVADSLCSPGERVVFSAFAEGSNKLVSICSSRHLDSRRGYLQYRFGRPGKVELQFPPGRQHTQRAFTYTRYTRPLVTYLTLTFTTNNHRYSIHEDSDAEFKPASSAAYITVAPPRKRTDDSTDLTIQLRGKVKGSLISLEDVVLNKPWAAER
jgi:hypothetical protein